MWKDFFMFLLLFFIGGQRQVMWKVFYHFSAPAGAHSDSVLLLVRAPTFSDFEHFCQYI